MRKNACLLLVGMTIPLLTGCALLSIGRHEPHIEAMSTLPTDAEAFVQFEAARVSLASGNYAAAIAEFSYARSEPSLLAPALNGMAVAYAHLGREDLAERYFREALAAAPDDARFAANLQRLLRSRGPASGDETGAMFARAEVPAPTVVRAGASGAAAGNGLARVYVEVPQQRLQPLDAARVELSTFVSEPAANGAQVRLRIDRPGSPAPALASNYPVRVSLRH